MNQSRTVGYDVIGDVHGHLDPLIRLLKALGYRIEDGAYGHPERHARVEHFDDGTPRGHENWLPNDVVI